ncbi:hypothetical protein AVEN_23771-1 [Araneus ventricosus]|uniref:RNase H type-1 domain-containing protein n=1 Tax=Araneus ventricosus TaxID=182803 RepID=A0A4Y2HMC7_ARAVE|nr:hypothetical protein AVEN_23771-1 [Araneus ventricosus]
MFTATFASKIEGLKLASPSSSVSEALQIFTNGSKTDKGTASAFCVFRRGFIHHKWWAKLDDNNSVLQAEMVAFREAMLWLSQESLPRCTIRTDSQSSLKALAALQPNSTIAREAYNRPLLQFGPEKITEPVDWLAH